MRFVGSMLAFKGAKFNHSAVVIDALSYDEAIGIGLRLAREKYYPQSKGYNGHSVALYELEALVSTLENKQSH